MSAKTDALAAAVANLQTVQSATLRLVSNQATQIAALQASQGTGDASAPALAEANAAIDNATAAVNELAANQQASQNAVAPPAPPASAPAA